MTDSLGIRQLHRGAVSGVWTFRTAERCWELARGYAFFAYPVPVIKTKTPRLLPGRWFWTTRYEDISKLDESSISNPEIRNLKLD